MEKSIHNGSVRPRIRTSSPLKAPLEKHEADDLASLVSFVSEESHRMRDAFSKSVPKMRRFFRENWRPLAIVATVGLGTYGVLRTLRPKAATPGKKRKQHSAASVKLAVH